MNFGEKLKRIRTEKNLTQPQFAEAIGIEQSYLSKLENDKSTPSAEMFSSIIKSLQLEAKDFLADIDRQLLQGPLRHIPEVSQFLSGVQTQRVHDARKYLYGAAAALIAGFALMLAANDGIVFPNKEYKYVSQGVILPGESDDAFEKFDKITLLKMQAGIITFAERARLLADFETGRAKVQTVQSWEDRGVIYFETVPGGRRKFEATSVQHVQRTGNKMLQYLGALLTFSGLLLPLVEWRVRKVKGGQHGAA
ncbi:helix-turn-helix domain-containing protein [Duganella callida]|uniref:XRE family transcriptional regulator n=1 Tax=Duganella callida TaxID=2561932 RepID=A0A4Y9SQL8_9BURK|nr:helix-turn-helix transcriptional regulator [Duganella callida]TFW29072.1 XRE family transcriptional regulator [Duganella callida]